jgi:diguanylate cyclase (GGDEF)-like protein
MPGKDPDEIFRRQASAHASDSDDLLTILTHAYGAGGRSIAPATLKEKMLQGVALWADLSLAEAAHLVDRIGAPDEDPGPIKTQAIHQDNHRLCALTLRDGLTGLFNRRYLDYCIEHEIQRVEREFAPCSILFADIDHFKQVNDRYGHERGDTVLRGVADLLQRTLRQTDISARMGGEEFVAVLPGTSVAEAARAAHRLCETVAAASFGAGGHSIRVTLSCGVATYFPRTRQDAKALLKQADDAMYRAKERGRNRVELYRPEADQPPPGVTAEEKDGLLG